MSLLQQMAARAKANPQRIILPEGSEIRTLKAADRIFAPEQHEPDKKRRRHRRHRQRHIRCRPEDGLFCFTFLHRIFRRIGKFCQFLDGLPRGAVRLRALTQLYFTTNGLFLPRFLL